MEDPYSTVFVRYSFELETDDLSLHPLSQACALDSAALGPNTSFIGIVFTGLVGKCHFDRAVLYVHK